MSRREAKSTAPELPEGEASGEGGPPDRKQLLGLAEETNAVLLALLSDRRFSKLDPLSSPRPLFNVIDFLRRTYLEYVLPLFPKDAPYKIQEMANPYLFDYADPSGRPFTAAYDQDLTYIENDANWPEWTSDLTELWVDAVGRNFVTAMCILQRDAKGLLLMGGEFDFQPNTVELAKALAGEKEQVVEYEERMQDARRAAGLAR